MVKGIEVFKAFFKDYEENYILIGGAACSIHEEINAQEPRATKDLDIILVVEALSEEFVKRFWEFIEAGDYTQRQVGQNTDKHEYYRFLKPKTANFPVQLELFSRRLDGINLSEGTHLTPIPTDAELSSLSAILMDKDYYHYVITHSQIEEGIKIANPESLICLKAKAYIDIYERRKSGENIDSKQLNKHKKDIFRLVTMIPADTKHKIPDTLKQDIITFADLIKNEIPDSNFFKNIGFPNTNGEVIFQQLLYIFNT